LTQVREGIDKMVDREFVIRGRPQYGMPARAFSSQSRQTHALAKIDGASSSLIEVLSSSGYTEIRSLNNQWCAVKQFNYTTAVVVGLDEVGYQRRYRYEHQADAQAASPWLSVWAMHGLTTAFGQRFAVGCQRCGSH